MSTLRHHAHTCRVRSRAQTCSHKNNALGCFVLKPAAGEPCWCGVAGALLDGIILGQNSRSWQGGSKDSTAMRTPSIRAQPWNMMFPFRWRGLTDEFEFVFIWFVFVVVARVSSFQFNSSQGISASGLPGNCSRWSMRNCASSPLTNRPMRPRKAVPSASTIQHLGFTQSVRSL